MDVVTLCTSDSRPKYANDALSVLALPPGANYHFRYEAKYLPAAVQACFEAKTLGKPRLLIAFKSEPRVVGEKAILVPLRWASLTSVERITDFFVIRFIVGNYASFRGGKTPQKRDELEELTSIYLTSISSGKLPVHEGPTTLVELEDKEEKNAWINIAKALALHATFSETHFLRISNPTNDDRKALSRDKDGYYKIKEGNYIHVPIDYFANSYSEHECVLNAVPDGQMLRIASEGKIQLDSRYDSILVWFQAKDVSGRTRSEIQIQTTGGKNKYPNTVVKIPVVIHNSFGVLLMKVAISCVGAFLIAVPGLLGPTSDFWLRASIAGFGALAMSVGLNAVSRMK